MLLELYPPSAFLARNILFTLHFATQGKVHVYKSITIKQMGRKYLE